MVTRYVECDNCMVIGPTLWGPGHTEAAVRRQAREGGWSCTTHHDLCPSCRPDPSGGAE